MKNFRKVLIGMIVALAVIIPLGVVTTATHTAPRAVIHIADGPTPTPTENFSGGNSGCHGILC